MGLRKCHIFHRYLAVLFLTMVFVPARAQDASNTSTAAGDNTKINQRDQNKSEATADQQKNSRSDLDITKEIRRSLTQDKSLSTYAHNVKVITQDGKVTLKGPVRSDEEKSTVTARAAQIAGAANINDEMTVVAKHD